MNIEIVSYKKEYKEDLRKMKVTFQKYAIDIDSWKVIMLDKEYKEKAVNELLKHIKEKKGRIFIAKYNNKIAGYIAGHVVPYKKRLGAHRCKNGYIEELFIYEKYRRMGVGENLLVEMEKFFRDKKCDTLDLHAMAMNEKALKFYKKQGLENRSLFLSKALNKKWKK